MERDDLILGLKKVLHDVAPKAETLFYSAKNEEQNTANIIYLLILMEQDTVTPEEEDNITTPIYDMEMESNVIISIIVMTKKRWEAAKKMTMFYYNIMSQGILL